MGRLPLHHLLTTTQPELTWQLEKPDFHDFCCFSSTCPLQQDLASFGFASDPSCGGASITVTGHTLPQKRRCGCVACCRQKNHRRKPSLPHLYYVLSYKSTALNAPYGRRKRTAAVLPNVCLMASGPRRSLRSSAPRSIVRSGTSALPSLGKHSSMSVRRVCTVCYAPEHRDTDNFHPLISF